MKGKTLQEEKSAEEGKTSSSFSVYAILQN